MKELINKFIFDDEKHIFTLNGKRLDPSVTQLLKAEGYIDGDWFTPEARDRGNYVHKCTHLHDENRLDDSRLHEEYAPYVLAYQKFLKESGFIVERSELPLYSVRWAYAGVLDKLGRFPRSGVSRAVLDLKTGALYEWTALQLAGYVIMLTEVVGAWSQYERFGLQLRKDGTYRLKQYEDRDDCQTFLSALSQYRWKRKHGYHKEAA